MAVLMAEAQSPRVVAEETIERVAALFHAHHERVFNLILRMTKDPEKAADLAQDTWVRVLRGLSQFRGQSSFVTWLHRIAVNLVLEDRRNALSRLRRETSLELGPRPAETVVADPFVGRRLKEGLNRLPSHKREVVWLHDARGLTHAEIGQRLGCRPGTSRSQLHKGRAMLRQALADDEEWLRGAY